MANATVRQFLFHYLDGCDKDKHWFKDGVDVVAALESITSDDIAKCKLDEKPAAALSLLAESKAKQFPRKNPNGRHGTT